MEGSMMTEEIEETPTPPKDKIPAGHKRREGVIEPLGDEAEAPEITTEQ